MRRTLIAALIALLPLAATADEKPALTEAASLELVKTFCAALKAGEHDRALALTADPFEVMADGELTSVARDDLAKMLKGKLGQVFAERAASFEGADASARYLGPESPRAKRVAATYASLAGCAWVGFGPAADKVKKPFAVRATDKGLVIAGFHDD